MAPQDPKQPNTDTICQTGKEASHLSFPPLSLSTAVVAKGQLGSASFIPVCAVYEFGCRILNVSLNGFTLKNQMDALRF